MSLPISYAKRVNILLATMARRWGIRSTDIQHGHTILGDLNADVVDIAAIHTDIKNLFGVEVEDTFYTDTTTINDLINHIVDLSK